MDYDYNSNFAGKSSFLKSENPSWGLHPDGAELARRGAIMLKIIKDGRLLSKCDVEEYSEERNYLEGTICINNNLCKNCMIKCAILLFDFELKILQKSFMETCVWKP